MINQLKIDKKYVLILITVLNIFLLVLTYGKYRDFIGKYNNEYSKVKEMKFLLNNRIQTSLKADETSLSQFLKSKNFEVDSIYTGENGIEVKLKQVNPYNLVEVIYELESNGINIKNLKAVDNTGLGKMSVFMVVR
ncbi:hypothetical protein [Sulfurihydrogenibium subterraneum]|uniref:hypothetical protein n=1 Tax=Sulfurihydrogenibium subterraneum TaxID=171121 RepID=UPI0012EBC69E|nr:hypothetical protein [Sulfurihydrogenibium subterraneum]